MLFTWDDIDLESRELFVDASISKNGEERTIPMSPLLVAELAGWGIRTGYLISSTRAKGPRYRQPRAREVARACERAGVSERTWKQSPHHAFDWEEVLGLIPVVAAALPQVRSAQPVDP